MDNISQIITPFLEIIQQNWEWLILILISGIWYRFNHIRVKRLRRKSEEYQKEYYECFDNDGNLDEGKYKEFIRKQKKTLLNSNSLGDRDETRFWM